MHRLDNALRRALDLIASSLALVLLAPVFLAISLAVKVGDGGPVFYRARRVGKDNQHFSLYKFRTMVVGADKAGPGVTTSGDARVTSVGRWLRRTKLDELPQLVNVLLGDMSLVGPRPEDPRYVALYDDRQQQILRVRPGITSAASLRYVDEEKLLVGQNWETVYCHEVMPSKLAIDLEYINRRTVAQDVLLIIRTIRAVVA